MNLVPVFSSHAEAKVAMDTPLDETPPQPAYLNVRAIMMMTVNETYREYVIISADHIVYYTPREIWQKLHDIGTEWI